MAEKFKPKIGDIVVINGESLNLEEFGHNPVRCRVVAVRKRTLLIRDPKGRDWETPAWSVRKVRKPEAKHA